MSYIGRSPQIGGYHKMDTITCDGSTAYTMQLDGANFSPESANHLIVSVNGVIQAPVDSFTVSASTITFASALSSSDTIDFIMALGNTLDIGTPSDGTVTTSKLASTLISGATELASEPADTDEFLVSDAGVLKRIDYSLIKGGGITEADQWRVTTNFSGDQDPVASNWERNDTDFDKIGTGMTQSSGVFTFPSTGIYHVEYCGVISDTVQNRWTDFRIEFTTNNGSNWNLRSGTGTAGMAAGTDSIYTSATSNCILDVTNTSTHKVRFSIDFNSTSAVAQCSSGYQYHGATFIRLGDT